VTRKNYDARSLTEMVSIGYGELSELEAPRISILQTRIWSREL